MAGQSTDVLNRLESSTGGMAPSGYDYLGAAYPDSVTTVYTFRSGGASGTLLRTLTLTYTDTTKNNLSSIASS